MHCNKITVKSIFNYIESIPRNIIDFELVKRNGKYIENIDRIQPLTDKIIQATGHYCQLLPPTANALEVGACN